MTAFPSSWIGFNRISDGTFSDVVGSSANGESMCGPFSTVVVTTCRKDPL